MPTSSCQDELTNDLKALKDDMEITIRESYRQALKHHIHDLVYAKDVDTKISLALHINRLRLMGQALHNLGLELLAATEEN